MNQGWEIPIPGLVLQLLLCGSRKVPQQVPVVKQSQIAPNRRASHTYLQHVLLCQGSAGGREARGRVERELREGGRCVESLTPPGGGGEKKGWRDLQQKKGVKCCCRSPNYTSVAGGVRCGLLLCEGNGRVYNPVRGKGGQMIGWLFSPQPNSRLAHRSLNPHPSHLLPLLQRREYLRSAGKQQPERGTVSVLPHVRLII